MWKQPIFLCHPVILEAYPLLCTHSLLGIRTPCHSQVRCETLGLHAVSQEPVPLFSSNLVTSSHSKDKKGWSLLTFIKALYFLWLSAFVIHTFVNTIINIGTTLWCARLVMLEIQIISYFHLVEEKIRFGIYEILKMFWESKNGLLVYFWLLRRLYFSSIKK